ncbi:ribosomal protection-like ABC-F family protein [Dyadobacter sp. CY323]|uniref:ribosomal protection-like ABC-F family protein n=1 Tax=Dyadobacter sp. CY323 TaxID=2907302 RepID=UPI001F189A0A|nr:ABC-F family ATP-binding cassette domain-containing protein [Dyadobacter sp. CY323]MCE6991032.1 ATP-binding cassette domain-containing protein [Dyadobacter sp. CY323]
MVLIQDVTYVHPNGDVLFADLNLTINKQDKIALIGNNGSGKSTLLKIISGDLRPSAGFVRSGSEPYYIPQLFGQFNGYSVARALRIEDKLAALTEILNGQVTEANMAVLDDDWGIEEKCREAFAHWRLADLDLFQKMETLSGGQKTKVFLAGILIHQPEIVLLDEPSNHLDMPARKILYEYLQSTTNTVLVVSHDRTLLNLSNTVCELSKRGITVYGGNFEFYSEQKKTESDALNQDLKSKEKALRKAKEVERESIERQQKLDARGKQKQEKAGLPTISMNTFRNNAEKSTSRMKGVHAEKVGSIAQELSNLRSELPDTDKMKMDFDHSSLHRGKILITAEHIQFGYEDRPLWAKPLDFQIISGERIALKGANGSGKSTLIRMVLGDLQPQTGSLKSADFRAIYIDQDYSLINNDLTVYEQAKLFNSRRLQEHEIKIRLNRFLFSKFSWDKPCQALSGGEKMRLMLCMLTIHHQAPDMIVLDEPTNNLDIQNIEILTEAINAYKGTLLVVSHDAYFLEQIGIEKVIELQGT